MCSSARRVRNEKRFKFGTDLDGKAKEELIRLAYEGKERSYSPYSGFQVGAALLAENGRFI